MKFNITIDVPDEYFLLQAMLKGGGNVEGLLGSNGLTGQLSEVLASILSGNLEKKDEKKVEAVAGNQEKPMSEVDTSALDAFLGFDE